MVKGGGRSPASCRLAWERVHARSPAPAHSPARAPARIGARASARAGACACAYTCAYDGVCTCGCAEYTKHVRARRRVRLHVRASAGMCPCPRELDTTYTKCNNFVCGKHANKTITYSCIACPFTVCEDVNEGARALECAGASARAGARSQARAHDVGELWRG